MAKAQGMKLEVRELLAYVREVLAEKKAEDILALDLRAVSPSLDYFVVATAQSPLHLEALRQHVEERLAALGLSPRPGVDKSPRWVVLDYGEVVVHLMTGEARSYYDLEGFWADAERVG